MVLPSHDVLYIAYGIPIQGEGTQECSSRDPSLGLLTQGLPELALPAYGHDHADDDRGCNDNTQKILQNYAARVGSGDALLSPISWRSGLSLYPRRVGGL